MASKKVVSVWFSFNNNRPLIAADHEFDFDKMKEDYSYLVNRKKKLSEIKEGIERLEAEIYGLEGYHKGQKRN